MKQFPLNLTVSEHLDKQRHTGGGPPAKKSKDVELYLESIPLTTNADGIQAGVDVRQPETSVSPTATSQAASITSTNTTTHAPTIDNNLAISQAIFNAQTERQYCRKRSSFSEAASKLQLEDFRLSIETNKLAIEVL